MQETRAYPAYYGDDLGATLREKGETVFKVWAPAATAVTLNLFHAGNGCPAYRTVPMHRIPGGVWARTEYCGHGTYYTFTVTGPLGTREAVDPYARSVGVNGERGMVVDSELTDPPGFRTDRQPHPREPSDAVIWEVHVRDFSVALPGCRYPGKYLAFTEGGLRNSQGEPVGLDYLKRLGVTHIHLQPVYDFGSLDESLPEPGYNWGYDPKNYNAPEGTYATDPYHGEVRVRELKALVHALHQAGLGVIFDMVYNHTYRVDTFETFAPGYFYRHWSDGSFSNGSGCGNELASELTMVRKFIVDSVSYWAEEYRADGFRFDLMALMDVETMQAVERAVHAINPYAILYGEGWTGGTSALPPELRASKENSDELTGVAFFNDVFRDGMKGSVFHLPDRGYIAGGRDRAEAVRFGLFGGFTGCDINYMSCHDNHTLWDKLGYACPEASPEEKARMVRFGATVVLLSRGIPFLLAGEEMLRTKQGEGNSYRSSDTVNHLDWEALRPGSEALKTVEHYRNVLNARREFPFLRHVTPTVNIGDDGCLYIQWKAAARAVTDPGNLTYTLTMGERTP